MIGPNEIIAWQDPCGFVPKLTMGTCHENGHARGTSLSATRTRMCTIIQLLPFNNTDDVGGPPTKVLLTCLMKFML